MRGNTCLAETFVCASFRAYARSADSRKKRGSYASKYEAQHKESPEPIIVINLLTYSQHSSVPSIPALGTFSYAKTHLLLSLLLLSTRDCVIPSLVHTPVLTPPLARPSFDRSKAPCSMAYRISKAKARPFRKYLYYQSIPEQSSQFIFD